jgi:hypothetical protein
VQPGGKPVKDGNQCHGDKDGEKEGREEYHINYNLITIIN